MMLALALCAAPLAAPQLDRTEDPPSVIVVLMDDIGRDKVAAYGDHPSPASTPNMDLLAARGVMFRNAWAYAACSPTRAALLTGRYAERTGMGTVIRGTDGVQTPLARDEFTIPAALPQHTSISAGKWHLADGGDQVVQATMLGFDAFVGWRGFNTYFGWTEDINGALTPKAGYYPETLNGQVLRTVQHLSEPYFLYYCPRLAHAPFHEPPAHLRPNTPGVGGDRQRHLQMVEAMDTLLGRLMDAVDLDRTYLIVLGDNGSPSSTVIGPPDGPFIAGRVKGSLYEGGVRVPFIVAGPGVARGYQCQRLVHATDILRTVVELTGAPDPPRGAEDSVSFAHLLADPAAPGAREWLYVSKFPFPGSSASVVPRRALRTDRWKLIDDGNGGAPELYDLVADPNERSNLLGSGASPAVLALEQRLRAMMPDFP